MQKLKHIWHYYKAPIIITIILISILYSVLSDFLGICKTYPDYQIAYVGDKMLPEDTVKSISDAIKTFGDDLNNDGDIIVKINQYTNDTSDVEYSSKIKLLADITDCESYFFLLDNPDKFQRDYEILEENQIYAWKNCPVLSQLDLGNYSQQILDKTITGDNQDLLSNLYFTHRIFSSDNKNNVYDIHGCKTLWEKLTKNAVKQ